MSKLSYKDAGVDTKEGEKAVSLMKEHVKKTFDKNVLQGLGGFGALYELDLDGGAADGTTQASTAIEKPVLVSGTDGVGTKLKIAFLMDKHDTIGQDCVAMCVNDILCQGAKPLFFLDYIATGNVTAEKIESIVKGVADGCEKGGCALIGGETAEMPGFYADGEYDMAGFAVGIVDKSKLIDGSKIKEGDKIIGITSSGIHSNGYSLVRKLFFEKLGLTTDYKVGDKTLGELLLEPTKIYTKALSKVLGNNAIHGIIHITGGGFYENIPRIIPDGLGVKIDKNSWPRKEIFELMAKEVEEKEMFSTFNMGIGMMLIVDKDEAQSINANIEDESYIIGEVCTGEGVTL